MYYSVDHILGGGIKVGELTELTGVPSSGKTQVGSVSLLLCSRFCVCVCVCV